MGSICGYGLKIRPVNLTPRIVFRSLSKLMTPAKAGIGAFQVRAKTGRATEDGFFDEKHEAS